MITKIIEVTNGELNWGKFMLARYDVNDRAYFSRVAPQYSLLHAIGTNPGSIWVLDLQTGEGAYFWPHGSAHADLNKHKIWVCPLYEPFLEWLYKQDLVELEFLPDVIELPNAEAAFCGYRRDPELESLRARIAELVRTCEYWAEREQAWQEGRIKPSTGGFAPE